MTFEDGNFIPFDMSSVALQIKTDSPFGSGDVIHIKFKEAGSDQNARGFSVALLDPPRYRVSFCTGWEEFEKPTRVGIPRIWTVTYTAESLRVYCEHAQVCGRAVMCTVN